MNKITEMMNMIVENKKEVAMLRQAAIQAREEVNIYAYK